MKFLIDQSDNNNISKLTDKKLVQAYWETKPLIYIFKDINYLNQISSCIEDKHVDNKRFKNYVSSFLKIINNHLTINNLNLNALLIFKQLISALLIISLSNKLIVEIKEDNYSYISKFKIINEISDNLKKFIIFFDENNLYNLNDRIKTEEQLDLIDYILNVLNQSNFIVKKNKKIKNEKNGIQTHSYYALEKKINNYDSNNIMLRIYFSKLDIIDYDNNQYYKSMHFLSISEIYRPNVSSKKKFILNKHINTLNDLNNLKYYFDINMFNIIYESILKEYSINKTLNDDEIEKIIYEKYLSSLKNIFYSVKAQKENSKLYHVLLIIYVKKYKILFNEEFYLSYYFDFRGRLYSDSVISPTGNKWFRFLYNYGIYNNFELENIKFYDKKILQPYYDSILNQTDVIKKYPNIINKTFNMYIITICFFEIGKIYKSNYLNSENKLSYKDFIDIGITEYNKFSIDNNNIEKKKELEFKYIINILNSYNNSIYIKFIIWKDATASAIQLQMLIYGTDNENNYKYVNLINDGFWRDTYSHIINLFKEEINKETLIKSFLTQLEANRLKNLNQNLKKTTNLNYNVKIPDLNFSEKYFNRNSLKKTIMTYNYSASSKTCYEEFLHEIEYDNKKTNFLYIEFILFYKFIEYFFNCDYFFNQIEQSKLDDILSEMFKSNIYSLQTPDNSTVFYDYLKSIKLRKNRFIDGERKTVQFQQYINEIDEKKTKRAFKPNFIHSVDGTIVRIILKLYKIAISTVHDSFGIDILNVMVLIKLANIAMNEINKKNKFKFYSNFVLL